ncbi:hypothetical protein [Pontibacter pamirensis]|uniref:hypothetical protein n=1 Tax=Pontibacter pamirensis TaxID=2562824 RepID=UPI00138A3D10|nr:hypothetical protein [Pontibacter pamirensis]
MTDFEVLQEIAKAPAERIDHQRFAELTKGENAESVYHRLNLQGHVEAAGPPGVEEMNMPPMVRITMKGKSHIASSS